MFLFSLLSSKLQSDATFRLLWKEHAEEIDMLVALAATYMVTRRMEVAD